MAYIRAWNEGLPTGAELPGTIDDLIRQLKIDIRERMNVVVTDWTADPVVLKPVLVQGPDVLLDWSAGKPVDPMAGDFIAYNAAVFGDWSVGPVGATAIWWMMPCPLPIGARLETFHARVSRAVGGTIICRMYQRNQVTGAVVSLGSITSGSLGPHDCPISLAHTILDGFYYFAVIELDASGGGARFYGIQYSSL